jgi:hypothetical protein
VAGINRVDGDLRRHCDALSRAYRELGKGFWRRSSIGCLWSRVGAVGWSGACSMECLDLEVKRAPWSAPEAQPRCLRWTRSARGRVSVSGGLRGVDRAIVWRWSEEGAASVACTCMALRARNTAVQRSKEEERELGLCPAVPGYTGGRFGLS